MKLPTRRSAITISLAALVLFAGTACDVHVVDLLAELELQLNNSVDRIQVSDPRTIVLPSPIVERGDAVVIGDEVVVIVSIQNQLVIEELPDLTLLGFENLTGFDMYLWYSADGVDQEVFVFEGETLLLEYPCLEAVQLWGEEDYDMFGNFVQSFDLDVDYFNPEDFYCGEALIITLDPFAVTASIEVIVLSR